MAAITRRIEIAQGQLPPAGAKRNHTLVIHAADLTLQERQASISQLRLELAEGAGSLWLPDTGRDGYLSDGRRYVIV